jgi:glucokinase
MAGELGQYTFPWRGCSPTINQSRGATVASWVTQKVSGPLTGIENNLLPYWLTQFPDHPLGAIEVPDEAARQVRAYGETGDEMALRTFEQQAMALGRLFTIAANYTDPSVYFLGGGVVESTPAFRDWFMGKVREHTVLREEQTRLARFAVVPDLDMAGARGAALAALATLQG